jgi:hypothetical protein
MSSENEILRIENEKLRAKNIHLKNTLKEICDKLYSVENTVDDQSINNVAQSRRIEKLENLVLKDRGPEFFITGTKN